MKTLSVRQPWAWLICNGHKDIENRTWRTSHRGTLLIHASQTVDREAVRWLQEAARDDGVTLPETFPTGAIVGGVTLRDCVTKSASGWFDGPVGWVLSDPFEFVEPIPASGRLGLWDADVTIEPEDEPCNS